MMPCVRGPEPPELAAVKERGTRNWKRRLSQAEQGESNGKHKPQFNWPQHQKEAVNRAILPDLRAMTAGHCAYCDGYPLGSTSRKTIDHFKPKAQFPETVLEWSNLFYACDFCQGEKGDRYDDDLVKPDEEGYNFEDYFLFDYKTGEIYPNPRSSAADIARAETTISILGLNQEERPYGRLLEYRKTAYQQVDCPGYVEVAERAYRFIFGL